MREARNPRVPQVTRLGAQKFQSGPEGLRVSGEPCLPSGWDPEAGSNVGLSNRLSGHASEVRPGRQHGKLPPSTHSCQGCEQKVLSRFRACLPALNVLIEKIPHSLAQQLGFS